MTTMMTADVFIPAYMRVAIAFHGENEIICFGFYPRIHAGSNSIPRRMCAASLAVFIPAYMRVAMAVYIFIRKGMIVFIPAYMRVAIGRDPGNHCGNAVFIPAYMRVAIHITVTQPPSINQFLSPHTCG